jgi:hypothetical protein
VAAVEDTDGYAFTDPAHKKDALLGVVKFKESFVEFETRLASLDSVDQKIDLLEREVFDNLNSAEDKRKAPYIALNIIGLLHQEAREQALNMSPPPQPGNRIDRLKAIADRLAYELGMIEFLQNFQNQVDMTREAFRQRDERRMEIMDTWPDFVIENVTERLQEGGLDEKYTTKLNQLIADAERCKTEFGL